MAKDPSEYPHEILKVVRYCMTHEDALKWEVPTFGNATYIRQMLYAYRRTCEMMRKNRHASPEKKAYYARQYEALSQWTFRAYNPEGEYRVPRGYDYSRGPGTFELFRKETAPAIQNIFAGFREAYTKQTGENPESLTMPAPTPTEGGRQKPVREPGPSIPVSQPEIRAEDLEPSVPPTAPTEKPSEGGSTKPDPETKAPIPSAYPPTADILQLQAPDTAAKILQAIEEGRARSEAKRAPDRPNPRECEHEYVNTGREEEVFENGPIGQEQTCSKCGHTQWYVPTSGMTV